MKFFTVEERKKLLVEELSRIVEVIKEEYDPERIIVFGSMAGNNIHEWSDIDLLMVKRTSKRPLERVLELGRLVNICSFCDVRRMTKFLIDENVPPTIADLFRNLELDFC